MGIWIKSNSRVSRCRISICSEIYVILDVPPTCNEGSTPCISLPTAVNLKLQFISPDFSSSEWPHYDDDDKDNICESDVDDDDNDSYDDNDSHDDHDDKDENGEEDYDMNCSHCTLWQGLWRGFSLCQSLTFYPSPGGDDEEKDYDDADEEEEDGDENDEDVLLFLFSPASR